MTARAGEWVREEVHGQAPEAPSPQEPVTQFFDLFDGSVLELGGTRPDRLVDVRPQELVQRRTVEQLVDAAPCLPALDAPVPLVVEQLVTVLAEMEREEDAEMNQLEDRILQGAPVSAAEKAAWRRWASRGGESSSRRRKKKKKKLPRGYSQCKTVQKTGRLHRSKGVADVHAATSSSSSSFLVPCSQFIDSVRTSRCAQRRVPTAQTAQQTAEILQVWLVDHVVSMPVVAVQTVQPVEIPQLQFLDMVDMPDVAFTGVLVRTCRKLWKCRSCRSSSKNGCLSLFNDRCWLVDPDSVDVLFLDKVVLPVVMQDSVSGLDVQKTVDVPQLQFQTPVATMPVEIPQVQFWTSSSWPYRWRCPWRFHGAVLDEFFMAVQWGASGDSTGAVLVLGVVFTPVKIPQVQFSDKDSDVPVLCTRGAWSCRAGNCGVPQLQCVDEEVDVPVVQVVAVPQVQFHMAVSIWTRLLTCPLLYVRAQVRRKLWRSHSCSSWTRGTCPSLCNDRCPVVDVHVTMQRYGGFDGVVAVMSRFRKFFYIYRTLP